MLAKILTLMNDGRFHTRETLAVELGISESMLSMMIEQLIDLGYLQEFGPNAKDATCADGCQECSVKDGCMLLSSQQPSTLLVTPKGIRQLEKVS